MEVKGKWQQCGPVMQKVFEAAFIHLLGPDLDGVIIHSYREVGDCVKVNYEIKHGDRLFIGQTTIGE